MNKKIGISIIIIAFIVGIGYRYFVAQASVGSLNIYKGSVNIVRGDDNVAGNTANPIKLNDVVKVAPDSRVSIILKDGSVIRLEAGSEVEIASLKYAGGKIKEAVFRLHFGRLWSRTESLEEQAEFKVETPTVVASVRGTSYNTDYLDKTSTIYVSIHSVLLELLKDISKSKLIKEGTYLRLRDNNLDSDFSLDPKPITPELLDDWVRFNKTEDKKFDPVQTVKPSASPIPSRSVSVSPTPTQIITTPLKKISSLILSAPASTIEEGGWMNLKTEAVYSDGSKENISGKVKWQQDVEYGSITPDGYFHAILAGQVTITVSYQNILSNPLTITVLKKDERKQY